MGTDLERWRGKLAPLLDDITILPRRKPAGQLVKSLISGRTRDAVSLDAYRRLGKRYHSAARIADAPPDDVAAVIYDVTFAEQKSRWLVAAMAEIRSACPDFNLDFLAAMPIDAALGWLERLPGVGRKVAASTLNASSLARPVFIVDTHVLRVLRRLRFMHDTADISATSEAVTAARPGWDADDFLGFHVATKRLGQIACHETAPACGACLLQADCPSARHGGPLPS